MSRTGGEGLAGHFWEDSEHGRSLYVGHREGVSTVGDCRDGKEDYGTSKFVDRESEGKVREGVGFTGALGPPSMYVVVGDSFVTKEGKVSERVWQWSLFGCVEGDLP